MTVILTEADNREVHERFRQPAGAKCDLCGDPVAFPRIVGDGISASLYHPFCASKIVEALASDLARISESERNRPGPHSQR